MNILVCFKVSPDLEKLSPEDWTAGPGLQVDLRFAPTELGCYDESALSFGLKLAEEARGENEKVKLAAVTLDRRNPGRWMKTLYALGYDECIFQPFEGGMFSPETTADALCAVAEELKADIILTGERSSPGGSSFTAPLLAEKLGRPCCGGVSALSYHSGTLKAEAISGDSAVTRVLPPLVVISVGNAPSTRLKVPTLRAKMAVSDKKTVVLPEIKSPAGPGITLTGLSSADEPRSCRRIEAGSAHDAAEQIIGYMLGSEDMQ